MIFPAIYAVLVWFLAMRWRRQWEGYASVAAGVAFLLLVDLGLRRLDHAMPAEVGSGAGGAFATPSFRSSTFLLQDLLRPYIGMVGIVGLYVASLPRRAPSEAHCRKCFYDLSGLDPRGLVCPECGVEQAYECSVCRHAFRDAEPAGLVCPECGEKWRGPGAGRSQQPLTSALNQSETNAPTSAGVTTPFPS